MRVLLVTNANELDKKLAALNPELEYCGIFVDDVESAKKTLEKVGLSQVPLYPLNEFKIYANSHHDYDYAFCVQESAYDSLIYQLIGLPMEKIVSVASLQNEKNWMTERHLRYYQEHSQEFEIFVTGISPTEAGIDINEFKRKAINFATSSQDLYYNFQIAKSVILCGGGHSKIRYALIGLTAYFFHYDLSKILAYKSRMLHYLIAFNDLHNFPVPIDIYKKFLREEWLAKKPSIQYVNINGYKTQRVMTQKDIDSDDGGAKAWRNKFHPETRDENIKILDDYLTLCEENNIRPIMFRVPSSEKYMSNFDPRKIEEFEVIVKQALSKHPSACFVDGWKLEGFTYADFYDHAHLNVHGAAKFSAYLNDFIEQLEFNYYRDVNNFHNRLNDSIEELDFRNHFGA